MLEKDIEKNSCALFRNDGWLVRKFTSPSQRGVPDRIMFKDGATVCIEYKQLGKKPTKLQEREHRLLREQGIPVFVIDSVTKARELLDMLNREMANAD